MESKHFQIILLVSLLSGICCSAASEGLNVTEFRDLIRENVQQMRAQVQQARQIVSEAQWKSFGDAVALIEEFHQFVSAESEKLDAVLATAKSSCVESLPKPVYAIYIEADWKIEQCIGHKAVFGEMLVEDAERKLQEFDEYVSLYPVSVNKDYFLSDWATEAGVEAIVELLHQRMQHWDNVKAMDLYNLKKHVPEEFDDIVANYWTRCVNYNRDEMQKLFDDATRHIDECDVEGSGD